MILRGNMIFVEHPSVVKMRDSNITSKKNNENRLGSSPVQSIAHLRHFSEYDGMVLTCVTRTQILTVAM